VPSYYLRYYYAHDEAVQELIGVPTRGGRQVGEDRGAQLLAIVSGTPALETKPDPASGSAAGAF